MSLRRGGNSALLQCQICQLFQSDVPRDRFVTAQCGHVFHEAHLRRWINENVGARCPLDKKLVDLNKLVPLFGYDPSNRELKVKMAVLGDSGVGKTCLVKRFTTGVVNMNVLPTAPYDVYTRNFEVDFEKINLTIWEPAGTERFHTIIPQCLRDVHGIIFCYDPNHFQSLVNVNRIWKELASRYVGEIENYVSILLECKNDMNTCSCENRGDFCRPVTEAEKNLTLQLLGINWFSTSAKESTMDNVEAPFKHVIQKVLRNEILMEGILNDSLDRERMQLEETEERDQPSCWEKLKNKFC